MVSWGVAFGKGFQMFLWSIGWGIIGGLIALAVTWGTVTNPSILATNPGAFVITIFLGVIVSTLVASIGVFASVFKVTAEWTAEEMKIARRDAGLIERKSKASIIVAPMPTRAPAAPNHLIGVGYKDRVELSWRPPDSGEGSQPTGYRVYKVSSKSIPWDYHDREYSLPKSALSKLANVSDQDFDNFDGRLYHWYLDYDVTEGETYCYRVTALNSVGESEPSNTEAVEVFNSPKTVECPKCQWGNAPTTEICRQCGSVIPTDISERRRRRRSTKLLSGGPVIYCPKCGDDNLLGAVSCRNCGGPIPQVTEEVVPKESRTPQGPHASLCPNCGMKLLEDKETKEMVCVNCGYIPSSSSGG